jgi:thiol-disulfide isomerase/thioredoxin
MRKEPQLVCTLLLTLLISCSNSPKDHVNFTGTITNTDQDSMMILGNNYSKTINLDREGSFRDTLKVEQGYYTLSIGDIESSLFLKNGFDLQMRADADSFINTVSFTGRGADNNNFIAEKLAFVEEDMGEPRDYFRLEKEAFDAKVDSLKQKLQAMFEGRQLDSALVAREEAINRKWINHLNNNYEQQHELYSGIREGKPSPEFHDFENYQEGTTSFQDLPESYLYIMVWTTGCTPCRKELPAWKQLRRQYDDANITFVGISVDEKQDQNTWKQAVAEQSLGGIQLHTGAGYYTGFIRDYNITEVPRFLLINPDRDIITAFAPAPSSGEIRRIFDKLEI